MTGLIWVIPIAFMVLGMIVQGALRSKFSRYSKVPLSSGLTGREVAMKMLRDNGIYDVQVVSADGFLSDHYNPLTKTVNLSPDVYNGISVAAAAVAAHECGHAVQHATAYQWLMLRSRLVPVVQFSAGIVQFILFFGIVMVSAFPSLLLIGIILFGITTLFSVITLPVEIDASKRALAWLNRSRLASPQEYPGAKDALKWAALTYVVAALASIATLVNYIFIFLGARDRD
jgi:uncharacterized protein